MSLLFDNACESFDPQTATRCDLPEGGVREGPSKPVPVQAIAGRARQVPSLVTDDGRVHIPLHGQESPALSDEYVTYMDHELRGQIFLFGPEENPKIVDADDLATSQFGQRLRFWTSEFVPESYPEYYTSPVDVVEESTGVVDEGFFEELLGYVDREEAASRDNVTTSLDETDDAYAATYVSSVVDDGQHQFRLQFDEQCVNEADDPEGVVRRELKIFPNNEVLLHGGPGAPDPFPLRATVTDVATDTIWLTLEWGDPESRRDAEGAESRRPGGGSGSRHAVKQYIQTTEITVEPHFNPVPYNRKRTAIGVVSESSPWDEVLTGRRQLTFDNTAAAQSAPFDTDLNQEQQLAVEHALRADELFCIHGPPGTGKTRTLVEVVRRAVAAGESVLVCADSNQAIDNVLVGSSTREEPDPRSLHAYGQHCTEEFVVRRHNARRSSNDLVRELYPHPSRRSDVVVSTNGSAATLDRAFDVAVLDEATQATCASSCIPLSRADTAVLAGDHRQLPPFSRTDEPPEHSAGLSLFEHLYAAGGLYEGAGIQLRRQYRMESTIAHFPNREFYDMTLESGRHIESPHDRPSIEGYDLGGTVESQGTSYANSTEAKLVSMLVADLIELDAFGPDDIGVITPYAAQVDQIRRQLPGDCGGVTVDTVDAFQGSERDAILVSFVRSNAAGAAGFLNRPEDGPRRLNVAITRAARYCALVGDWYTLRTDPGTDSCSGLYESLYEFLDQTGRMNDIDASLLP